jgi:hypothetical protein
MNEGNRTETCTMRQSRSKTTKPDAHPAPTLAD